MWMMAPVFGVADGPTEVHKVTVAKMVLKQYQPAPGLFPTAHLPTQRAAARAKFAAQLDRELDNL
jgi:acyl-CoA dehydrogenase